MIGKIFQAVYRLEDRVERMANDVAIVKEHTEYMGSRVRYEFRTEVRDSGDDNPPLRGEIDRLREEVQTILSHQGKALGELQSSLKMNQNLADLVENKIGTAIDAAIQNGKDTTNSALEVNGGKGKTPAHHPSSDDGMDWEEIVAETERLERAEQLATNRTAHRNSPESNPSTCKTPKGKKAVNIAIPPTRTGRPTKGLTPPPGPAPKPAPPTPKSPGPKPKPQPVIVSYAAAAKAAPQGPSEWTTVQRGGKSRGTRPQHQKTEAPKPVTGLNLDQRKFVFITDPKLAGVTKSTSWPMSCRRSTGPSTRKEPLLISGCSSSGRMPGEPLRASPHPLLRSSSSYSLETRSSAQPVQ